MSTTKLSESFEWVNPKDLPKERLLKVVMKTPETTIHPEDPKYPKRVFKVEELIQNGKSLIGSRVGYNHEGLIMDSIVVDSEWNKLETQLEGLLYVPPGIITKVRDGQIDQASIEYQWRNEKETEEGVEFEGLHIFRIDLLEGKKPGDKKTSVALFEAEERHGCFLMEMAEQKLEEGCVWSTQWDSPEACIAANQDKDDPEAYCMAKVEAKTEQDEEPTPTTEEDCKAKGWHWYDGACHKEPKPEEPKTEPTAEELKESLKRVLEENKKLKEDKAKEIEDAQKEFKKKLIEQVSSVIPHNVIVRQSSAGMIRLIQDVRKVLRKVESGK